MSTPEKALSPSTCEKCTGLILGVLMVCAFALKAWLLWKRSIYIDPDEGYYMLLARSVLGGHGYTMNGLPNIVFPPFLPLMIAAVSLVTENLQLSLGIITSVSGTLLGLVAYKLAREWVAVRPALLTAFLVLFIYPLNAFVPTSMTYAHTLYRGSDVLNCLLVLVLLFLAVRTVRTRRIAYALGAGAVAALSYLTRPEGLILWGLLLAAMLMIKLTKLAAIPAKVVGSFALVFVLLSAPYVIYLRTVTGHWALSGKYVLSREYRASLIKVLTGGDWGDFQRIHYAFNPVLMEMNDHYFGYYPGGPRPQSDLTGALANVPSNLALSPLIPRVLFPYALAPFFLVGLAAGFLRLVKKRADGEIVVFSAFLYSALLAGLSYPVPRHHLFLIPLFCIYAVRGVLVSVKFLVRFLSAKLVSLIVVSALLLAFATDYLASFNRSLLTSRNFLTAAAAEKDVALYLKGRHSRVVMTFYPAISIRCSSDWQVLPRADLSTLIRFSVKKHVDHIVLSGDERRFYRVIDLEGSAIPVDFNGEIGFQTVESQERFEVVKLVALGAKSLDDHLR